MTTNTPAAGEMPVLPSSLLNTIGEYGMARTDRVSELTVQHRWELLITGIKDYASSVLADQLAAQNAEIARLQAERPSNAVLVPADKLRELQADARRYRWLRDTGDASWRPFGIREGYSAAKADAAIDAASQPMGNGGEHAD